MEKLQQFWAVYVCWVSCQCFFVLLLLYIFIKSIDWKCICTSCDLSCFLYSVVGSIVDSYLPDLVLQGVQDNNFRGSLSTDLKFTLQVSDVNNQCTANQLMFISQCIYSLLRNSTDTIVDHVISLPSFCCLVFVFMVITSLELILI